MGSIPVVVGGTKICYFGTNLMVHCIHKNDKNRMPGLWRIFQRSIYF